MYCLILVSLFGGYDDAYTKALKQNQPLVILIGAEWCPSCVRMEKEVIPEITKRGLFKKRVYVKVDVDKEKEVGQKLSKGQAIPQLIIFWKKGDEWHRKVQIGYGDANTTEAFITKE